MGEQPPVPETPDEDLPQDPGIPDGAPAPDEDEDSLERPSSARRSARDRRAGVAAHEPPRRTSSGCGSADNALSSSPWRRTSKPVPTTAASTFADRLADAVDAKRSQLLVGLDPRPELLPVKLRGERT